MTAPKETNVNNIDLVDKIRLVSYNYAKELVKECPEASKEWLIQRAFYNGAKFIMDSRK